MDTTSQAPPADADIRPVLLARVEKDHRHDPTTVVISELGLCRNTVRADLAAVNGIIHGYEIKSDRDSLRRLETQVEVYGRVFDRATLVVGERHIDRASAMVPAWWGVLRIYGSAAAPKLKVVRRGRANPDVDPRSLVELLWLDQAVALLESRELACGVRGKPRWVVWDRICEHFTKAEVAAAVRQHLKEAWQATPSPS